MRHHKVLYFLKSNSMVSYVFISLLVPLWFTVKLLLTGFLGNAICGIYSLSSVPWVIVFASVILPELVLCDGVESLHWNTGWIVYKKITGWNGFISWTCVALAQMSCYMLACSFLSVRPCFLATDKYNARSWVSSCQPLLTLCGGCGMLEHPAPKHRTAQPFRGASPFIQHLTYAFVLASCKRVNPKMLWLEDKNL